jgi:hypothetical protein
VYASKVQTQRLVPTTIQPMDSCRTPGSLQPKTGCAGSSPVPKRMSMTRFTFRHSVEPSRTNSLNLPDRASPFDQVWKQEHRTVSQPPGYSGAKSVFSADFKERGRYSRSANHLEQLKNRTFLHAGSCAQLLVEHLIQCCQINRCAPHHSFEQRRVPVDGRCIQSLHVVQRNRGVDEKAKQPGPNQIPEGDGHKVIDRHRSAICKPSPTVEPG